MGPQKLIWAVAVAVVVARCGPRPGSPAGPWFSGRDAGPGRCRRGGGPGRPRWRRGSLRSARRAGWRGPPRARRAAVNEISRGWTTWPARLPLRAGTATAAAARAVARTSSAAVTPAACSWPTRAGERERSIGPVDGPAPLIADLDSFGQVSDPIHGQ